MRVAGVPASVANITQAPIAASRRWLVQTYPQLAKKFFAGRIKFEEAHPLHEGNSANLAIAALFYCAAAHFADQRQQYRLAANVAITGDLSENGETRRSGRPQPPAICRVL
ncbi:MAG: hypothetical protein ACREOO_28665 [bacterium]